MAAERWQNEPEKQDFLAAESFLSLLMEPTEAAKLVRALETATELQHFKAKDLLRASGLPALPPENRHVASDLAKVVKGKKLSPVLVVRDRPTIIADGYHRICASYHLDENEVVPCRIVSRAN